MAKVIQIIEDNGITGVRYGTVEIPETPTTIKQAQKQFEKIQSAKTHKVRSERTKKK